MTSDTKEALASTLLHTIELVVCLLAALFLLKVLNVSGEMQTAVISLVFAAVAKFARAHDDIPVGDYINERK